MQPTPQHIVGRWKGVEVHLFSKLVELIWAEFKFVGLVVDDIDPTEILALNRSNALSSP